MFKEINQLSDRSAQLSERKVLCSECHSAATPDDYAVVERKCNMAGVVSEVSVLRVCYLCSRFEYARGTDSVIDLYYRLMRPVWMVI